MLPNRRYWLAFLLFHVDLAPLTALCFRLLLPVTIKNPASISEAGLQKPRCDSYLLPGPPSFPMTKWAEETKNRVRPLPRIEHRIVPADALIRCGLVIRIK